MKSFPVHLQIRMTIQDGAYAYGIEFGYSCKRLNFLSKIDIANIANHLTLSMYSVHGGLLWVFLGPRINLTRAEGTGLRDGGRNHGHLQAALSINLPNLLVDTCASIVERALLLN